MLRSVAISRIQQGLGFRTDLTNNIILMLQEAQRDLEGAISLPWFLKTVNQSLAVTAGSQSVTVPSAFLRVVEDEQPYLSGVNYNYFLVKKPYAEAKVFYESTDAGPPKAYSIREDSTLGTFMTVWPMPDVNYTLTWSYYARGALLDSDISNAWLDGCPEILIGLAGMLMAADLENEISTKKFGAMYQKWAAWLISEIAAREQQGQPFAMGRIN